MEETMTEQVPPNFEENLPVEKKPGVLLQIGSVLAVFNPKPLPFPAIHENFSRMTHLQKTAESTRYWLSVAEYSIDRNGNMRAWWKLWFYWLVLLVPVAIFFIMSSFFVATFFDKVAEVTDYLRQISQNLYKSVLYFILTTVLIAAFFATIVVLFNVYKKLRVG
ncbi:MAG: hypothetical protein ACRC2T_13435 [Thermoguttaceae bacterium]